VKAKLSLYEKVRPQLKTGDILLFEGKSLVSRAIRWFTKSRWSHVAMVYKASEDDDIMLCFESTSVSSGTKGVRLVELSRKLLESKSNVYYRALMPDLNKTELKQLKRFRKLMLGVPYERSYLDLLLAGISANRFGGDSLKSVFCSEMVAAAYQTIGRFKKGRHASSFAPVDLSTDARINLPLKDGSVLTKEQPVYLVDDKE
jgi:hypothetical protein